MNLISSPNGRSWALLAALALCYLIFTYEFSSPYAGPADSSGYLNCARCLLANKTRVAIEPLPGLNRTNWNPRFEEPLGFLAVSDHTMVPSYPVGFPLHLALAGSLAGLDRAAPIVNVFSVLAAGALMLALSRECGFPWAWGAASVVILFSNPLFLMFTEVPMSDALATVWGMAAICFGRWARRNWLWGLASGASLAIAVLVRPSNLILILPVAVAIGQGGKRWLALVLGGFPGALFLATYNTAHFGGPLINGAGNPSRLFGLRYAYPNLKHYLWWLTVIMSPASVGTLIAVPFFGRKDLEKVSMLAVWILAVFGVYLFYGESGGFWWSLRFILPAVPPLILAGLVLVRRLLIERTIPDRSSTLLSLALGVVLAWQLCAAVELRATAYRREAIYPDAMAWMTEHFPSNGLVAQCQTSGSSAYYTSFPTIRWDLLSPDDARHFYKAARALNRPIYAAFLDNEPALAFQSHLPGEWQRVGQVRQASFWRLVQSP